MDILTLDFNPTQEIKQDDGSVMTKLQIIKGFPERIQSDIDNETSQASLQTPELLQTERDTSPKPEPNPIDDYPFDKLDSRQQTINNWAIQRASVAKSDSQDDQASEPSVTYDDDNDETCTFDDVAKTPYTRTSQ